MKEVLEEVLEKVFEGMMCVLGFIIFVLIIGVIGLSPIIVPIIVNHLTSNQMFGWISFGVCAVISISTIIIIAKAIEKSNEREKQQKINSRYHIVKDEGYYL